MIRFTLTCPNDHSFDSWFRSGDDCDRLLDTKQVACPTCGNDTPHKALMAPPVRTTKPTLKNSPDAEKIATIRRTVEANADDVGTQFATQARAMHDGDMAERAIYGQASGADAQKLIADGVPVLSLPFIPTKKTN